MSDLRNCPFCDEEIRKKAKLCRFCKKAVEPIYVEDKKVNSQIVKILNSIEAGEDYVSVASKLNESRDYRVDTGAEWDAEKVEEVYISFTKYLANDRKKRNEEAASRSSGTPQKKSSNKAWYVVAPILFLVVIASIVQEDATQEEIMHCKNLIYLSNGYATQRMEYMGMESGTILISYKRTTANENWNLRCKGDKAQVWAPGAGIWMDL